MFLMFLLTLGIDENAINEDDDEFVQVWFAHTVHEIHENRWCVCKTKWHDQELIMAIPSSKSCLGDVFFLDTKLMVTGSQIDFGVVT